MNKLVEDIEAGTSYDDLMQSQIEAVITQLKGQHGWKLVPVEPTEAQNIEAGRQYQVWRGAWENDDVYRAYLAASPDPLGDDDG